MQDSCRDVPQMQPDVVENLRRRSEGEKHHSDFFVDIALWYILSLSNLIVPLLLETVRYKISKSPDFNVLQRCGIF